MKTIYFIKNTISDLYLDHFPADEPPKFSRNPEYVQHFESEADAFVFVERFERLRKEKNYNFDELYYFEIKKVTKILF